MLLFVLIALAKQILFQLMTTFVSLDSHLLSRTPQGVLPPSPSSCSTWNDFEELPSVRQHCRKDTEPFISFFISTQLYHFFPSSIHSLQCNHCLLQLYVTRYLISINQGLVQWQPCHTSEQLKQRKNVSQNLHQRLLTG